jgi:hypothetical protein
MFLAPTIMLHGVLGFASLVALFDKQNDVHKRREAIHAPPVWHEQTERQGRAQIAACD